MYSGKPQSAVEENGAARKDSELESYRLRLKEELISRDGYRWESRSESHIILVSFYVLGLSLTASRQLALVSISTFPKTKNPSYLVKMHSTFMFWNSQGLSEAVKVVYAPVLGWKERGSVCHLQGTLCWNLISGLSYCPRRFLSRNFLRHFL